MKNMNTVKTACILLSFITLVILVCPSTVIFASMLDPQIRFDNPYIQAGRKGQCYLDIGVPVPGEYRRYDDPRPSINIVLVIDRSGSMGAAGKMEYVRRAALDIIFQMQEGDTAALVAFSDYAQVIMPAVDAGDPGRLAEAIGRLYPGGSTNLGDGLIKGYREARRFFRPGGVNRIILLTDGLANRGVTDPFRLASMVSAQSDEGIFLSTFGVGLEYNENLLANLADAGRGSYYYIASPRQIPEMLSREFGQVLNAVYLDVTVTITIRSGYGFGQIMGYPYRLDNRQAIIHLGDLSAGAEPHVISGITYPARSGGLQEIGTVGITYKKRGEERITRLDRKIALHVTEDRSVLERNSDSQVHKRAVLARAAEEMSRAARLVDEKRYREANRVLSEAGTMLKSSPVRDREVLEQEKMLDTYADDVLEAPAMAPAEVNHMQKKTKFEIYKSQRGVTP